MKKIAACGTPSGYQRHKRLGEEVDDACNDAHNAYHRKYRETHTSTYDRKRNQRQQALIILAQRHPNEYLEIIKELSKDN